MRGWKLSENIKADFSFPSSVMVGFGGHLLFKLFKVPQSLTPTGTGVQIIFLFFDGFGELVYSSVVIS